MVRITKDILVALGVPHHRIMEVSNAIIRLNGVEVASEEVEFEKLKDIFNHKFFHGYFVIRKPLSEYQDYDEDGYFIEYFPISHLGEEKENGAEAEKD